MVINFEVLGIFSRGRLGLFLMAFGGFWGGLLTLGGLLAQFGASDAAGVAHYTRPWKASGSTGRTL